MSLGSTRNTSSCLKSGPIRILAATETRWHMHFCRSFTFVALTLFGSTLPTQLAAQFLSSSTPRTQTQPSYSRNANSSGGAMVFNVASYGASGSSNTGFCSGTAGSNQLYNCNANVNDFAVGQQTRIVGGGPPTTASKHPISPITATPVITQNTSNSSVPGPLHTYCYVVSIADPLQGISAPSPTVCSNPEPDLSLVSSYNELNVQISSNPFSPAFLWYVSKDGGAYQLLGSVGGITGAYIRDVGQAFLTPTPMLSGAESTFASRGGWPTNVAISAISKNEDLFTTITGFNGTQVTTSDAVLSNFNNSIVYHDDTLSIQSAIDAAVSAGGGTIQFAAGTYCVEQPLFVQASSLPVYFTFSRDYGAERNDGQFSYLAIGNNASGAIHLEGAGVNTVLVTPPDEGILARLIAVGSYGRLNDFPGPALLPIYDVQKGSTQLILAGNSGSNALKAGNDIYLYSGSFGAPTPCTSENGIAGGCHFSELNTVVSVASDGNTITLAYPASKRYYPDQFGSSRGVLKLPVVPHDVALEHMSINTYDPITGGGYSFGMLMNDLHINGYVKTGPLGNGYRRGLTIENSFWGFGAGDDTYNGVDEYDQFTDVSFINNNIYGNCATQASGRSAQCRIYGTEGSSRFTFTNNNLYSASVYFDQTTDDTLTGNNFYNGILNLGLAYGQQVYYNGYNQEATYISFGSSENATVSGNTFEIDSTYATPWVLRVGNLAFSNITGNTVTYNGTAFAPVVWTYAGSVTDNSINIPYASSSNAIVIVPDEVPGGSPSALSVKNNIINAPQLFAGIYVPTVGFNDPLNTCIQGNTYTSPSGGTNSFINQSGQAVYANMPSEVNFSCP